MTIVVISPHLDDAVLSLGQMIAASDEVVVVTVFAGIPTPDVLSAYDESCGFESSFTAMTARRYEDVAACGALGAAVRHLEFFDRQYAPDRPATFQTELSRTLAPLWDQAERVYAPLGIGHPDHQLVGRAARAACQPGWTLFAYEELPYRVMWPEQVVDVFDEVARRFDRPDLVDPAPVGDRAAKEAAIAKYVSQFPHGAEDPCLLVPERCWRLTRRAT